jgi:all-trans-8'-apo-beta-carotenal 15,15'-oxygenase
MIDNAPLLERAFALEVREGRHDRLTIDGELPPYVRGTCFFNGPGRFSRAGLRYRHWLDGDGLVCALALGPGGAAFANRFVRSEKFVREEAEGRPVFRTFGTAFAGDQLKRGIGLVSPVNVSIYPFNRTLLAFGEQGLPWEIDPRTLETRGLYTFGSQLNEVTPFSAHPKIDHVSGELFNFGVSFSAEQPMVNAFRFAGDGHLVYRRRVPLPYASSMHDFAISGRYVVFYVSPLVMAMDVLLSGGTLMDALSWRPDLGTHIMILSRETGEQVASLRAGDRHCLHLVNAFDRESDGRLVVDLVEFEKPLYPEYQIVPDLFIDTFRGRPVRLAIDVAGAEIADRSEIAYDRSPDFPAHDPALTGFPYDHFWMLGISRAGCPGRKFFDQLVRVDWPKSSVEVFQAPPTHYLGGEPAFIPDPAGGRRGAVVCQMFDAERTASSFVVFDAFAVSKGPTAVVHLPEPVPLLFHSVFVAQS